MIKIRLARRGRTHKPVYSIVASDVRSPRDGRFIEYLGQYDPQKGTSLEGLNEEALKRWVTNGAQVSSTVKSLLKKNKVSLA